MRIPGNQRILTTNTGHFGSFEKIMTPRYHPELIICWWGRAWWKGVPQFCETRKWWSKLSMIYIYSVVIGSRVQNRSQHLEGNMHRLVKTDCTQKHDLSNEDMSGDQTELYRTPWYHRRWCFFSFSWMGKLPQFQFFHVFYAFFFHNPARAIWSPP